ncbi:MAG: hypothetical protein NEA02_01055 [Thermoanaerobaculia bacterium]|nr:hypothetical protein [Thermoanaerobaculia bacterium]
MRRLRRLGSWILTAAALLLWMPSAGAEECKKRICRSNYSFDGTYCEAESGFGWRSHYRPASPVCPDGWDISGQSCVKKLCCEKAACRSGETYRDGFCYKPPSGIGGYMSHYEARCEPGWAFNRSRGTCRNPDPDCAPFTPGVVVQAMAFFEITGYAERCARKGGSVTIQGNRFGAVQGPNRVLLGGHGISVLLPVTLWSPTRITVTIPDVPRIVEGRIYYIGIQNDENQWLSGIDKSIAVCQ